MSQKSPLIKYIYRIESILGRVTGIPFTQKCRKRIKNRNFSIICSNCIGGTIYHRLGMQFLSPTVNLWFYQDDFIKFICDLKGYLSKDLQFIPSEFPYPVGMLGDIRIMFNHTSSEEQARNDWNRRRSRVNFDNLYIILYDSNNLDLAKLRTIPCKRLVVLSAHEHPEFEFVKTIHRSTGSRPNNDTFLDRDASGLRTYEKQFDFVAWLNGEENY